MEPMKYTFNNIVAASTESVAAACLYDILLGYAKRRGDYLGAGIYSFDLDVIPICMEMEFFERNGASGKEFITKLLDKLQDKGFIDYAYDKDCNTFDYSIYTRIDTDDEEGSED